MAKAPKKLPDFVTIYRFCGQGECIPGLPTELTRADADALGLLELFDAALADGNYQPIGERTFPTAPKEDTQEA